MIPTLGVIIIVALLAAIVIRKLAHQSSSGQLWSEIVAFLRSLLAGQPAALPYRKVDAFLTPAERSFYEVLRPLAEERHLEVFPKVRLSDIVFVPRHVNSWQAHQNRIQQKHLDFILCDCQVITPVLGIELDDSSHRRSDRIKRDELVDEILGAAGLPILRVEARWGYNRAQLASELDEQLGRVEVVGPRRIAGGAATAVSEAEPPLLAVGASGRAAPDLPATQQCPRCGAPLVERRRRQGGDWFWGCSSYPSCRYTRPGTVPE